jgi:hypothetical protein
LDLLQIKCQPIDSFLFIYSYSKPFLTALVRFFSLINAILYLNLMESNEDINCPTSANSEDYDPNHPQNLNKPAFNSTTDHRSTTGLPGVENLDNHNLDENQVPQNIERLSGSSTTTDLGNGERTQEDKDDEKIIER